MAGHAGQTTGANVVNQNTLAPIQVSQTVFNPIATANVNLSANLPDNPHPHQSRPTSTFMTNLALCIR